MIDKVLVARIVHFTKKIYIFEQFKTEKYEKDY